MPNRPGQRAKVFKNGRSRAVRIPKEFDFDGDEVIVRKESNGTLSLEPLRRTRSPKELVDWLKSQPPIGEDFSDIKDFPPEPVDLDLPK